MRRARVQSTSRDAAVAALRGYTGNRLDQFDLYPDTRVSGVWAARREADGGEFVVFHDGTVSEVRFANWPPGERRRHDVGCAPGTAWAVDRRQKGGR